MNYFHFFYISSKALYETFSTVRRNLRKKTPFCQFFEKSTIVRFQKLRSLWNTTFCENDCRNFLVNVGSTSRTETIGEKSQFLALCASIHL